MEKLTAIFFLPQRSARGPVQVPNRTEEANPT